MPGSHATDAFGVAIGLGSAPTLTDVKTGSSYQMWRLSPTSIPRRTYRSRVCNLSAGGRCACDPCAAASRRPGWSPSWRIGRSWCSPCACTDQPRRVTRRSNWMLVDGRCLLAAVVCGYLKGRFGSRGSPARESERVASVGCARSMPSRRAGLQTAARREVRYGRLKGMSLKGMDRTGHTRSAAGSRMVHTPCGEADREA